MKVLGILGSPRPGGNSDLLLEEALAGAKDAGAETEKIEAMERLIEWLPQHLIDEEKIFVDATAGAAGMELLVGQREANRSPWWRGLRSRRS